MSEENKTFLINNYSLNPDNLSEEELTNELITIIKKNNELIRFKKEKIDAIKTSLESIEEI